MRALLLLSLLTALALFAAPGASLAYQPTTVSTTHQVVVAQCGNKLSSGGGHTGCDTPCGPTVCDYDCYKSSCQVIIFLSGNGVKGSGAAASGAVLAQRLPITQPPPSLAATMSGGVVGAPGPKVQPNRPVGGLQ